MEPNIPGGGVSPEPAARRADLWPEVKAGLGERPKPTWRPRSQPAFGLHGIGFLMGTRAYGQPHLERISAWARDAVDHGKPLAVRDGAAVVDAYLGSKDRMADHTAWMRASLQAVHLLPEMEDVLALEDPARIASIVNETHGGWMKTAPRFVAELLAEARAGRAA